MEPMSRSPAADEGSRAFRRMWHDLSGIGLDDSTGGYRRFAWSRIDHDLREWFEGECRARGLDVTTDRMGNQWAWWGDPDAAVDPLSDPKIRDAVAQATFEHLVGFQLSEEQLRYNATR